MTLFFYYQRKKDALNIYYRVKLFLKEELNLSLNDKSCYFKNTKGKYIGGKDNAKKCK